MADVLATGQGLRDQEIAIERPDGMRIVALVNIEAIKDGSGRVIGAVNVFRGKSEQPSAELRPNGGGRKSDELLQGLPTAAGLPSTMRLRQSCGVRPELGTGEFCGSWRLYWPDGTPAA
jgi:hypothetical protein